LEIHSKNEENKCPATVHETVCVKAKVTITPDVKVHDIKYYCIDGHIGRDCLNKESCTGSCTFEVGQKICVEIPLTFSAEANVDDVRIVCGPPKKGKCYNFPPCKPKAPLLDSLIKSDLTQNLINSYFPMIKNLIKGLAALKKSKKGEKNDKAL